MTGCVLVSEGRWFGGMIPQLPVLIPLVTRDIANDGADNIIRHRLSWKRLHRHCISKSE